MKPSIKWALIGSMASLLWLVMEYVVGLHDKYIEYHPIVTNFALIIPILALRQTVEDTKRLNPGLTFQKAFSECAIGVLLTTFLAPIGVYVFFKYVNPDFFNSFIQYAVVHADQMHVTKEKALQRASSYFNFQMYIVQTVLSTLFGGLLIGVVVSYLQTRNQRVEE